MINIIQLTNPTNPKQMIYTIDNNLPILTSVRKELKDFTKKTVHSCVDLIQAMQYIDSLVVKPVTLGRPKNINKRSPEMIKLMQAFYDEYSDNCRKIDKKPMTKESWWHRLKNIHTVEELSNHKNTAVNPINLKKERWTEERKRNMVENRKRNMVEKQKMYKILKGR